MSRTKRLLPAFVLSLLGLTYAPVGIVAQSGTSVLTLLSVEGRRLALDTAMTGALSSSDMLLADDTFAEAWALDGRVGQSITIDLRSDEFDPYLYVVGPGFTETLRDDDSGGGCDARIAFTFLESGLFRVIAGSLRAGDTGTYTLRASSTPGPVTEHDCGDLDPALLEKLPFDERRLSGFGEYPGFLAVGNAAVLDGRPVEAWALEGVAGEAVTITLEADDFDPYLYVMGPGIGEILEDDDSAGELNAQITFTFPETATYRVVASALSDGSSGGYTLRLEEPVDVMTLSNEGRMLLVGETMTGSLLSDDPITIDGRRGQIWATDGVAGRTVTIDLVSDDFDSYLYVIGPGIDEPMSDDDSGGGLHARVTLTFTQAGEYRIIATSLSAGTGTYTLSMRTGR